MNIHPLWYICILVRIVISQLVLYYDKLKYDSLKYMYIVVLLIIGGGFIYKSIFGSNDEIQLNKVFWHNSRPVHGMLYLLSATYLFLKYPKMASLLIILDIIFSIIYRFAFTPLNI